MRLERKWADEVAKARLVFNVPRAETKRRVTLHIVLDKGERGCDPDAYFKVTGDALKNCGALIGDSRKWVEWVTPRYSREPGKKRTEILLEDIIDGGAAR